MKTLTLFRNAARRLQAALLLLAFSLALAGVAEAQSAKPLVFQWNYPTNTMSDSFTFKLYSHTSLSVPLSNWTVVANFPATDWYSTNGVCIAPVENTNHVFTITNMTVPGAHFFYVTVSNFWQESDPSNVLALPPVPGKGENLRAQRGW